MNSAPSEISIPAKLHPPIDVSAVKNENGVKKLIKALLDAHGWFHWAAAAGAYTGGGVHDRLALKDGVFLTVEAKFGYNKPTPLQNGFAGHIVANNGFAFCVNEKNIDHFAWWLESFAFTVMRQREGLEPDNDHGARMLNAMHVLMAPFGV